MKHKDHKKKTINVYKCPSVQHNPRHLLTTGELIATSDGSEENSSRHLLGSKSTNWSLGKYIPDVEGVRARSDSTVKQKNGSQINNNISSTVPKKFMSSVCSALYEAARASRPKSGLTLSYDVERDWDKTHKMWKACLECECFTAAVRF